MSERVFLVTGVAGHWGARVAARLLAGDGCRVIGLDAAQPIVDLAGLDFVQADVRNPLLGELLTTEGVDTVCHLALADDGRSHHDLNVGGTANVMEACAAAGVQAVVVMSRTTVYGARPGNSAFLTEESALRPVRRDGSARDLAEMEAYIKDWRQQVPGVSLAVLRFPHVLGPSANTPLARFLLERRAPMVTGYDPRMQVIHEDDVVGALVHAALARVDGTFNVAAEGILPLSKMRGLAGKPPLSVLKRFAERARRSQHLRSHFAIETAYLCYPCVADLGRMRAGFGYEPRASAEDTVRDFVRLRLGGAGDSQTAALGRTASWLRDVMAQRRLAATGEEGR